MTLVEEDQRPPRSRWLRTSLIVLPAVIFVGLLAVAVADKKGPPQPGDMAPTFEAELLMGGGELASSDLKGKPAVINFWASWCAPCEDEAPLLREAAERYGDRITFLGVDILDARSDAIAFAEKHGLDYLHVRDTDRGIYDSFGLTGQPETFFIDEEGRIVEHVPGPVFEESFFQLLDLLVARSA
jgi:cytochrome c biogenesis protein CcmG/thiol:disulfide interchange protein DsbE